MRSFMKQFEGLRPTPRAIFLGDLLGVLGMVAGLVLVINLLVVHCG